jgi:hypothetical protein
MCLLRISISQTANEEHLVTLLHGTATRTIHFLDQSIDQLIPKAVSEPHYERSRLVSRRLAAWQVIWKTRAGYTINDPPPWQRIAPLWWETVLTSGFCQEGGDAARCRTDTEHHEPAIPHEMRNEMTTMITNANSARSRRLGGNGTAGRVQLTRGAATASDRNRTE